MNRMLCGEEQIYKKSLKVTYIVRMFADCHVILTIIYWIAIGLLLMHVFAYWILLRADQGWAFPRFASANCHALIKMHGCDDFRFSLNNRLHFQFVSRQTLPYALRTLGIWNELHGIFLWQLNPFCTKIEVFNSLNGQVQAFFLHHFCDPKTLR